LPAGSFARCVELGVVLWAMMLIGFAGVSYAGYLALAEGASAGLIINGLREGGTGSGQNCEERKPSTSGPISASTKG